MLRGTRTTQRSCFAWRMHRSAHHSLPPASPSLPHNPTANRPHTRGHRMTTEGMEGGGSGAEVRCHTLLPNSRTGILSPFGKNTLASMSFFHIAAASNDSLRAHHHHHTLPFRTAALLFSSEAGPSPLRLPPPAPYRSVRSYTTTAPTA